MRHVLLTGLSGSGKSTVGPLLAHALGMPFVDLDAAIAARTGRSVADLVASSEPVFRDVERVELAGLEATPSVVALGGGALTSDASWEIAERLGTVVWLVLDPAVAAERLKESNDRPLLQGDVLGKLRKQAKQRARWYARADRLAPATAAPIDTVIAIRAALDRGERVVRVQSHRGTYPVRVLAADDARFSLELRALAGFGRVVFICDQAVRARVERLAVGDVLYAPGGEHLKKLSSIESMALTLEQKGCDRDTLLVAVGGGSLTDAVGFLASIYRRGVNWVSVPTTLLGMVDSSLGGKTGVNLDSTKNLLGSFYPPLAVFSDVRWLESLDPRDVRSGTAEMLKVAATHDASLFDALSEKPSVDMIARAAAIKAQVVSEDEFEHGLRKVLNFGHTFGHAFESTAGLSALRHGEAVALGMLAETEFFLRKGKADTSVLDALSRALDALGLARNWRQFAPGAKMYLAADKKRSGSKLRMPVVPRVGQFHWLDAEMSELEQFLEGV